jgi:toxin CptA
MHHAPSVTLPVGRSHWAPRLALLTWLGGLAALVLWWASGDRSHARLAVLLVVQGVAGWLSWRSCRAMPKGRLLWQGGLWHWEPAFGLAQGQAQPLASPSVVLDVQSMMLVRTGASDPAVPSFLWLERGAAGPGVAGDACWQALRRAVYSRAGPAAPPSHPDGANALP